MTPFQSINNSGEQETVFLSGTSQVEDLMQTLQKELRQMRFSPQRYTSPDFDKTLDFDAMTACLKVAKEADRMIVVIDKVAGNKYRTGKTITEEEFMVASKNQIPRLVFVRKPVFIHFQAYRKKRMVLKQQFLTDEQFRDLFIEEDVEKAVCEFIDRLYFIKENDATNTQWLIPFEKIDEIVQEINNQWITQKTNYLNLIDSDALFNDSEVLSKTNLNLNIQDFFNLTKKFSENLQSELRESLILEIIYSLDEAAKLDFFFASRVLDELDAINSDTLKSIIVPLCKIVLNKTISSSELLKFLSVLGENSKFCGTHFKKEYNVIIGKIIKHLSYNQVDFFSCQDDASVNSLKILNDLSNSQSNFWDDFFVDLYFRYQCNYINLSSEIYETCERVFKRLEDKMESPLILLKTFILSPLETVKSVDKKSIVGEIADIAEKAQNSIHCKWCILALQRLLAIYNATDNENDEQSEMNEIFSRFDKQIVKSSVSLTFLWLYHLLQLSIKTKNVNYLKQYEKEFVNFSSQLYYPQKSHLQLEYASCLYLLLDYSMLRGTDNLRPFRTLQNKEEIAQDRIFFNEGVSFRRKLRFNTERTFENLKKWLLDYIGALHELFTKRFLETNPNNVLQLNIARQIPFNYSKYINIITKSLINLADNKNIPPGFYSKSLNLFSFVDKANNIELIKKYILRAIQADKYNLIRNSPYIAGLIYHCFYYGDAETKDLMYKIVLDLEPKLDIGKLYIGMHWAYFVCIKIESLKNEKDFIRSIYDLQKHHFQTQNVVSEENANDFLVSNETISLIREYKENKSLLASVAMLSLDNSALWNLIGTTVALNRKEDLEDFNISAFYYSLAIAFSKGNISYDQKYHYNYIKNKSLYFINIHNSNKKPKLPPLPFFRDVITYLDSSKSTHFYHKKETCFAFFELIELYWSSLYVEIRQKMKEFLPRKRWIVKLISTSDFPNLNNVLNSE